ncbi:DUF1295-domain-containing protein [Aulographum hederae CBS 113979]|uniref:DUF1295-domain-containing protein n=1 Tax=Aulographum hederae CBS 113979 TaxID=1176131 RepID=A0A6G1GWJ1_9PEZI|nr:DUF1295-domain-containing protein [Aulographum hederae CBS 113979]
MVSYALQSLPWGAANPQQCADFDVVVRPFLDQLWHIFVSLANARDLETLRYIYQLNNPLISAFAFSLAVSPVFFIVSEINKNYSQVDRLWSFLPTIYNAHYTYWAHLNGLPSKRLDLLLTASCIWSVRLTFNYWRKGGYTIGSEDYRWETVKKYLGPYWMVLFNVGFIAFGQNILLFLVTTPTYLILLTSRIASPTITVTSGDNFFSRLMMVIVLVELFADQQQWAFQQAKKHYQATAKVPLGFERADLDRGFVVSGLWSWSRHPNFAAEQAFWLVLYQWGCYETETYYNWTIVGAVAYLILFQASTWFTELLTAKKYPEYAEYQQLVGKFVPKLFGRGVSSMKSTEAKKEN